MESDLTNETSTPDVVQNSVENEIYACASKCHESLFGIPNETHTLKQAVWLEDCALMYLKALFHHQLMYSASQVFFESPMIEFNCSFVHWEKNSCITSSGSTLAKVGSKRTAFANLNIHIN